MLGHVENKNIIELFILLLVLLIAFFVLFWQTSYAVLKLNLICS